MATHAKQHQAIVALKAKKVLGKKLTWLKAKGGQIGVC
jgi:hypothetical protein